MKWLVCWTGIGETQVQITELRTSVVDFGPISLSDPGVDCYTEGKNEGMKTIYATMSSLKKGQIYW